jgi:hypothetical protein
VRKPVISADEVDHVFDDDCIRDLIKIAKLSDDVDVESLRWWVREAAYLFAINVRAPSTNEVNDEIARLHVAARRRSFERVADLLDDLSLEAHALLSAHTGVGKYGENTKRSPVVGDHDQARTRQIRSALAPSLPTPNDLRDRSKREATCTVVANACSFGGQSIIGRRRPSGNRSHSVVVNLLAPKREQHPLKRKAELDFVSRLATGWQHVTGRKPPLMARHSDAGRNLGPFARFVRECLCLVGARYADPVALINLMGQKRRVAS